MAERKIFEVQEPNPYRDGEKIIEDDIYRDTVEALTALRDDVDNLNKRFRNVLFRDRIIAGDEVCTVDVNGIRYGYKLLDLGVTMKRVILMKPINGRFSEFSDEDRRKTLVPVFEVFLKEGYTDISIEAKGGCLEITQEFAIGFIIERNPNTVGTITGVNMTNGVIVPFPYESPTKKIYSEERKPNRKERRRKAGGFDA